MKDTRNTIIYVGKAKNLKRRVQSYFQQSKNHPQKIKKMVSNVKDFEYILTDTEFEAFMLECKLIRELKPMFNKMMKSPEAYSYVVINDHNGFRSIEVTQKRKQDGRLYFGPYQSKRRVETALLGIKESFKILCTNPGARNSPCLNYSLGLCIGMCLKESARQEYHTIIDHVIGLLEGTNQGLLEEMKKRMTAAAEEFNFETAAKYRDKIEAINFLLQKEKVIEFTQKNKNIIVIEYLSEDIFKFFLIKRNKILFSERYNTENSNAMDLSKLALAYFKNTALISDDKLNSDEIDESQIIYNYLKSNHCQYKQIPDKWVSQNKLSSLESALSKLLKDSSKLELI